jgi:pseudaminic acid synthase
MRGAYTIDDKNSLWAGSELYDLYQQAYTPWEWHQPIFERARALGMEAFSSPFDETAVDFLETLHVPFYKIASFENTHHPLLRKVARTGKPVIMSTGVASFDDIAESVEVLKTAGCKEIILLKCTSTYPATPENTNLLTIPHMRERWQCEIGLSDHTMGIGVALAAVGLGVRIIEKHFTLSRAEGGVDSAFSMEPQEMKALVDESLKAYQALGRVQMEVQAVEEKSLLFKRSIYAGKDIAVGETLNEENLKIIRPALGLAPKHWENIQGKKAKRAIQAGQPLSWDMID